VAEEKTEDIVAKRPWYVAVALIAMALLGFNSCGDGVINVSIYRGVPFDAGAFRASDRAAAELLFAHVLDAFDAVRRFAFPLSAAAMVIGTTTAALALAALVLRRATPQLLSQVLVVHAAVFADGAVVTQKPRLALYEFAAFTKMSNADSDSQRQAIASAYRLGPTSMYIAPGLETAVTLAILFAINRKRAAAAFVAVESEA
jgi:hypothetical protein